LKKYPAFVLLAGALWGFMGFFVAHLADIGIDSTGAVMVRCAVAAVCFGATLLVKDRRLLKVRLRDAWCFLGSGILALLFFTYCYFTSMNYIDMSTAAILLYTAPPIVMIISRFAFGEGFSRAKLIAVVMAFVGCCLVSGVGTGQGISTLGLLLGLGSGLGYALYSIFARCALNRGYDSLTVNFYSCALAAIGAMLIWGAVETFRVCFAAPVNMLWCFATGFISCFLPYLFYTYGLTGMETGKASIMASVEPVVATLVGIFVFGQKLSLMSACGVALVLGAIVVLNIKKTNSSNNTRNL